MNLPEKRGVLHRCSCAVFFLLSAWSRAESDDPPPAPPMAPLVVTASRHAQTPEDVPVGLTVLDSTDIQASPALTADDFLRQVPGFSLFRRTGSLTANPTAQGFTLRGIGPSGTSRGLVLYDGAPLNDAFGGWVAWSKIDLQNAERIEVVRGGGSTAWGHAALSGVVQILPAPIDHTGGNVSMRAGNRGTLETRGRTQAQQGNWAAAVEGRAFRTDGYVRIRGDRRGEIDTPADSRHESLSALLEHRSPEGAFFRGRLSYFTERRNNGTPLTANDTESWRWQHRYRFEPDGDGITTWTGFAESSRYASTFSSVSEDRSSEQLVLDQFRVPAITVGSGLTHERAWGTDQRATLGTDVRWIRGETRERVIIPDLLRKAGGEQVFAGFFAENNSHLTAQTTLISGLRADLWHNRDGFLSTRPFERPGSGSREDFEDRTEWLFSPRLGLVTAVNPTNRLRGSVYQGFRAPTLNELYRPFQVGADRTFANENLDPEKLTGAEIGWTWTPNESVSSDLTLFWNEIQDAVANVTLEANPLGGEDRQRQNLDRTRVRGIEWEGRYRPVAPLEFFSRHAILDSEIRRVPRQPELEGNRIAQVPRHQGTVGLRAEVTERARLTAQIRYESARYENDTNTRRLAGFYVVDLHYRHTLGETLQLRAGVENLLDRRYADGIIGDDLTTLGHPRLITLAATLSF
ncbi:MAG: TonB-dependent receptor [Verrucomicrobia bacterium]|nr:TonB-dependent receptor [Verrucomicrobiota bacterium]MCH8512566.1 TonB-dependent receptor [Kiritimatiellia bacterium]